MGAGEQRDDPLLIIEPGYKVWAKNYPRELVVEYEGMIVSGS